MGWSFLFFKKNKYLQMLEVLVWNIPGHMQLVGGLSSEQQCPTPHTRSPPYMCACGRTWQWGRACCFSCHGCFCCCFHHMLWQRSGSLWMTSLTNLPLELGLRLFRYPKDHDPDFHILIWKQGKRSFKWPHFPLICLGQYEGAVAEDGKSQSIWNTFAHSGSRLLF
jgi:hypothetical protein